MTEIVQIVTVMLAVVAGYVLGVVHTKRAVRDALEQLRREQR